MKKYILLIIFTLSITQLFGQAQKVNIENRNGGFVLKVDGKDFMINGMNWDYFPIGTNYSYSLWKQPEKTIKAALDSEMGLLKNMNVNAIRVYSGIPKKWITYIYENYGIYTMLNHTFGRYGLTIDGAWVQNTDYSNPKVKELLLSEAKAMVEEYKNTPGLLLFLLGNENNYGLFWDGAETEDIPIEDRKSTHRAEAMYKLFNEAVVEMKKADTSHPMAICNGDLLFLDIIVKECPDVDILGANMYRGMTFTDAFEKVKKEYNKPLMLTEFGVDAFNAKTHQEDQEAQAKYLVSNWETIYANAAGLNGAGNAIGGFTFQFSDGWWKYGQTKNLDVHDDNASWSNGGYQYDYENGENNMNEEWFGICAKGPTNTEGLYSLFPRAAYFALKKVHRINPYATSLTEKGLKNEFSEVQIMDAVLEGRAQEAALKKNSSMIHLSKLRAEFTTFNTGGSLLTTPDTAEEYSTSYPSQTGFDHMESYYIGVEATPSPNMRANVEFNILGNVANNPIDEIFYENRGRDIYVVAEDGSITTIEDNNRVDVYHASFNWNTKYADLTGFYRTGHYHWQYEGDIFGLYREANYGPNLDIYQGKAPFGVEVEGKKAFKGLTLAFGPELWWGANPAIMAKYTRNLGKYKFTGIWHEDLDDADTDASTSSAIPTPKTRRATLAVERKLGKFDLMLGGIWAGQPLIGREFQNYENGNVYVDKIKASDNWGAKGKITYAGGKFNAYAQAAVQGLVAIGGADQTQTFTGWKLKDTGSGNQKNFLAGFTYNIGNFQIAPNFLWQEPIVDAMPDDVASPGRKRNILDDPFVVRVNRKMTAGELLLTYDPTPGTWYYAWDNDRTEDAKFAMNLGYIYRHQPTAIDAAVGFDSDRNMFAFASTAPARDLWEVYSRIVSKPTKELGIIANLYGGNAQANGDSDRTIYRYGADVRAIYKKLKLVYAMKFDDWGPYDYHRDYNLTYPLQVSLDISTTFGKPDWFILPNTVIGIRGTWRTLDQYSPRYSPMEAEEYSTTPIISPVGFEDGTEWEIRTYIHINIGK